MGNQYYMRGDRELITPAHHRNIIYERLKRQPFFQGMHLHSLLPSL